MCFSTFFFYFYFHFPRFCNSRCAKRISILETELSANHNQYTSKCIPKIRYATNWAHTFVLLSRLCLVLFEILTTIFLKELKSIQTKRVDREREKEKKMVHEAHNRIKQIQLGNQIVVHMQRENFHVLRLPFLFSGENEWITITTWESEMDKERERERQWVVKM